MPPEELPGIGGFLGTGATLMLDVVVVAMAAVVPAMWWSIRQASGGRYPLHHRVQLALAIVLAIAVTAFEVDIRLHGWTARAEAAGGLMLSQPSLVRGALYVHLFFAVTTLVLWIAVVSLALRKFPRPAAPSDHSRSHRLWGKLAALDMTATAVTGWVFYALAFVF